MKIKGVCEKSRIKLRKNVQLHVQKFYKFHNMKEATMRIHLTLTSLEYALACLGAASLGMTLEGAIVTASIHCVEKGEQK